MGGTAGIIADITTGGLWSVTKEIGKLFGIETHDEVFTDIQATNLLTPGKADNFARKNAKHQAFGNHGDYFHNYRGWQREYRKKYSKKFLENLGYAPTSTASTQVPNNTAIEAALTGLGYDVSTIISARNQLMDLGDKKDYYLVGHTQLSGFDPFTGIYTVGGKNYVLYNYVAGATDNDLDVTWRRDHEETIIENLTTNYSYNEVDRTVVIGPFTYDVGPFDSNIYDSGGVDVYRTICTHSTEPDEVIESAVEYLYVTDSDPKYSQEVLWVRYRTIDTVTRYYAEPVVAASRLYTTTNVAITAIIPLKVNNSMVDLDSRKLDRMLRRLNLGGEDLRQSLENPDMDSAYLMTGIDPTVSGVQAIDKAVFQMFDLMSPGNGNVSVSVNKLSMKYSFEIVKTVETGVIADVGKYVKEIITRTYEESDGDGGTTTSTTTDGMILKYQINSTEYRQLRISEFSQTYTVSGYKFTSNFGSSAGLCRLVIPLNIYNGLRYKEFVDVYERSLCLLAYSMEVVRVKWYETAAFGTVLQIVAFVILVYSLGTATSVSAAVIQLAASLAILYVAKEIAIAIGGTFGAIVGTAVALAAMYFIGGFDGMGALDIWIQSAQVGISTMNAVQQHEMEEFKHDSENALNKLREKHEDLDEKIEEFEEKYGNNFGIFDSAYAGRPNRIFNSIERMVEGITNTSVEELADYGAQIDHAIKIRTNVVSGLG